MNPVYFGSGENRKRFDPESFSLVPDPEPIGKRYSIILAILRKKQSKIDSLPTDDTL